MVVYRLLSLSCAGWLECGDVKGQKQTQIAGITVLHELF